MHSNMYLNWIQGCCFFVTINSWQKKTLSRDLCQLVADCTLMYTTAERRTWSKARILIGCRSWRYIWHTRLLSHTSAFHLVSLHTWQNTSWVVDVVGPLLNRTYISHVYWSLCVKICMSWSMRMVRSQKKFLSLLDKERLEPEWSSHQSTWQILRQWYCSVHHPSYIS